MPIHAALHHVTQYRYDRPVQLGPQVIRLRPAPHTRGQVISYSLRVEPAHFINWQQDPFSNYQARLVFPAKTREFKVTVDLVVEMAVYNPFDFFLEPGAEHYPFTMSAQLREELAPYLLVTPQGERFKDYLNSRVLKTSQQTLRTIDFLVQLNQQVQRDIRYLIRLEPGVQTPQETLTRGSGSCRDSAWLLVQLLRHCGLAARFVSGYLIQLVPDVKSLDGPAGTEVDFTDLHAWCEVYLPGAGWVGLDPTSGLLAGEGHIPLACTPMPASAAPIEGLVDEAEVEFHHEMHVSRLVESARVTKPYTEEQWQRLVALGEQVDQRLEAGDVRLTLGGEPTFVAIDNRDAPEWNTEALGPTKRGMATTLVHKLQAHYGQGGFLHLGQGKWYPGEQLPRWALSIGWRADGQPCWHNPALFANESEPHHYSVEDAHRFIALLSHQLGVGDQFIQPGYEDTWYYLWRERRLPVNVDPFDSRLEDELERARLRRVFSQGLSSAVGYLLPLQALEGGPQRWKSGPWFFRDERMYLIPGDSPMGYRLPLDSLPWVRTQDYPHQHLPDPGVPREPLPAAEQTRARYVVQSESQQQPWSGRRGSDPTNLQGMGEGQASGAAGVRPFESAPWVTRTGLCVEVRDPARAHGPAADGQAGSGSSVLYVFMPPLTRLEDYLELLSAIEATAEALQFKLVLEGYPPPRDPRLQLLQVTPDPGVIEV
ncbi:MAG: IMP dehydrogenase, partial [Betaproteobacteria bacterium]|nr:IMP dehydrogenase [Betaproteobacteria bacterium]